MKRENAAAIAIVLLALAIRIYPVMANLPHAFLHDENNYIESALRFGGGNFTLTTFAHGALFQIALFALYALYGVFQLVMGHIHSAREFYVQYLKDPTPFFLAARITAAFCGAGVVWLTWRIASRIYNSRTGIIAALFAGFSLVMVQMSSVGLADVPALCIELAGFLALVYSLERPAEGRIFYAACFLSGLATACKYTSVVMLAPVFVAAAIARAESGKRGVWLAGRMITAALIMFVGFLIGMPLFLFNAFGVINDTFIKITEEYILKNSYPNTWLFYFTNHLRNGLGLPLECLSLAGVVYALFRRSKGDLLLLSFPAVYYLLVMNSMGYAYHTIPAIPFLLILGARLCDEVAARIGGKRSLALSLALGAAFVLPSASDSVKYVAILMARDTRIEAKDWIEKNIPAGAVIASEGYISGEPMKGPPLAPDAGTLRRNLDSIVLRGGSGFSVKAKIDAYGTVYGGRRAYGIFKADAFSKASLEAKDADYVILSGAVDAGTGEELYDTYYDAGFKARRAELREYVSARYVPLKTFEPTDGFLPFFPHLLDRDYRLLRATRFPSLKGYVKGPRIEIYKARLEGAS